MTEEFVQALTRFILGIQVYHEAFWSKSKRGPTWPWRFWGRCAIAFIAIVFFLFQQFGNDVHILFLSSAFVAYAVLLIGLLQAAAPLCYLALRFCLLFFVTERYKRDLERGKWPDPWKFLLVIISEAILILLSVLGFLSHPWYLIPLVFLWSIPVILFCLVLPSFVLWGLGHKIFLTLAHLDDRLERPEEAPKQYEVRGSKAT